ncbi:MAG TPA: hypothetical protein VEX41_03810 [Candidatus Eisenbacteria bacterium]|nr:hypothetical protein [Candidatus Eisenbacteria bacterium]
MFETVGRLRREALLDVDPAFTAHGWHPPIETWLDGHDLHFSRELDASRTLLPTEGLLTTFVRLELAPAEDVELFARNWGRLHLCAHALPYTHSLYRPGLRIPPGTYLPPDDADRPPEPVPPDTAADPPPDWWPTADRDVVRQRTQHSWGDSEPLAGWRYLAGQMAGVLQVAALLDTGVSPSAATWERAGGPMAWLLVERFDWHTEPALRTLLLSLVNELLALCAPVIRIAPTGLAIGGDGLSSALAMQLALAVAREETDFLPCREPGCTNPALRPRRGATPYCGFHLAHGVRRRDELRRHRERERERQSRRASG